MALRNPLSEEEYARAFATFVAGSTEYAGMMQVMQPTIQSLDGRPVDLMSIGAGTGCVEDDLVKKYGLNVARFLAIEPNATHRAQLEETVASWGEVDLLIDSAYFDLTYTTDKRFDLIIMSHSMYCVEDPIRTILKAISFLKSSGKLLIINQTEKGGHELYAHLRKSVTLISRPINDHFLTTKHIAEALRNNGVKYELQEFPSEIDVTEFIEMNGSSRANDVVTFLLQTDYDALDDDLKKDLYNMVKIRCITDSNGRHMFSHPNGMLTVSSS